MTQISLKWLPVIISLSALLVGGTGVVLRSEWVSADNAEEIKKLRETTVTRTEIMFRLNVINDKVQDNNRKLDRLLER